MSEILEKYKLSFSTKTVNDVKLAICSTNIPDYYPLSNFLCECYWPSMSGAIVKKLENIFTHQLTEDEFQTRGIIFVSNISETEFVEDGNLKGFNDPDLIIPTVDFKYVIVEWWKFLEKNRI